MKAEKLLERLTERQKDILQQAKEGKNINNENLKEIKTNVQLQAYEEARLYEGSSSFVDETEEEYSEVYRYLNALTDDEEVRKEKLLNFVKEEYEGIQKIVNKTIESRKMNSQDIVAFAYSQEGEMLTVVGIHYGFTDSEVSELTKGMNDITFEGIDWEEIEQ